MEEIKKCTKCEKPQPLKNFNKHNKSGHRCSCRKCDKIDSDRYYKTLDGVISSIYNAQKRCSKKRGHNPPEYTKEEFSYFIKHNKLFIKLFKEWENVGYETFMKPSIDRIDNSISYTWGNIQVMTWEDNNNKAREDQKSGVLHTGKAIKKVMQYTKEGQFINSFISISEAMRASGASHISCCCNSLRISSGGYIWKFSN